MFLFNSQHAFHSSYRTHMMQSDEFSLLYLFDTPMPTSFADIPFDVTNSIDISRNCVYAQVLTGTNNDDEDINTRAFTRYKTFNKLGDIRRHYQDRYGLWSLSHTMMIPEAFFDPFTLEPNSGSEDTATEIRNVNRAYRYNDLARADEWDRHQYTTNFNSTTLSGRSAQNFPLVFEYEQEVTARGCEYFSFSSSNNTPSRLTVEVWNPTGGDGTGAWESDPANVNLGLRDTFVRRRLIEFPVAVTGRFIRLRFNDTGGGNWAASHISLHGDEPTWGKDPVDLQWGLLGGLHNSFSAFLNRNVTSSFNQQGELPFAMIDVGDPGSGAFCELAKTTGLVGGDKPNIFKFDFEFKDTIV